jgi:hypothetical protein
MQRTSEEGGCASQRIDETEQEKTDGKECFPTCIAHRINTRTGFTAPDRVPASIPASRIRLSSHCKRTGHHFLHFCL